MTDAERYAKDPTRRWPTRNPGITYRLSSDLSRKYFVFDRGKRIEAGVSEKEALAKQADIRARRARGDRVIIAAKVNFSDVAEEWYADAQRRLRPGTAKDYRSVLDRVLLPRFGERGIGSLTPQDVVSLVEKLEKDEKASSTIANALKPLAGTLQYAMFKGLISVNPMQQIPRGYKPSGGQTREHREWTTEEVDLVISCSRQLDARKGMKREYAPIVEMLLRTGLRLGECLGLQFQDVDFTEGVLHIRRAWTKENCLGPVKTKTSERRVPLTDALVKQLATRSLELVADPDTFVFAKHKGDNPPSQSNFNRRGWIPAIKAAKLTDGPKVTPHDARHAFASQLADLNLTSADLAPILGHSSSGITETIYTHAFNREGREMRVREAMQLAQSAADRAA